MSNQDITKAELRARRSTRELEHSLDQLGVKLDAGLSRVEELKAQAGELRVKASEVVDKVKHPRDTVAEMITERGRAVQGQFGRLPPQARYSVLASIVAGVGVIAFFIGRSQRKRQFQDVVPVAAQANRYAQKEGYELREVA
jgi:hypothetical protein